MDEASTPQLKLIWSVDREPGFDLNEFAHNVLEQAKESLVNDGYIIPGAFALTEEQLHCFQLSFDGPDQKFEIYAELVKTIRQLGATALVTLNDGYWGEKYDSATYYQGKLAKEGRECIFVTISGPEIKSRMLEVKYQRSEESSFLSQWKIARRMTSGSLATGRPK